MHRRQCSGCKPRQVDCEPALLCPLELAEAIAKEVPDPRDKAALRCISRQWRAAVSLSVTHLRPSRQLWDEALVALKDAFPNLASLDLSGCAPITDLGLSQLAFLPRLQALDITGHGIVHGVGLWFLSRLTSLRNASSGHRQVCLDVLTYLPE